MHFYRSSQRWRRATKPGGRHLRSARFACLSPVLATKQFCENVRAYGVRISDSGHQVVAQSIQLGFIRILSQLDLVLTRLDLMIAASWYWNSVLEPWTPARESKWSVVDVQRQFVHCDPCNNSSHRLLIASL